MLYPQDGYWRARPLPPAEPEMERLRLVVPGRADRDSSSGRSSTSSEVVFDPATQHVPPEFHARRQRDAAPRQARHERQVLDVTLDPPVGGDRPFAALRSMFVTEINNDVAQLGWRVKGAQSLERRCR